MFRCVYPYHPKDDKELPSYDLIREHVEREKIPCLVMSPNGIAVGIIVNKSWVSIH